MTAFGALLLMGSPAVGAPPPQGGFGVGGDVDGLYPGAETTVQATVVNPQSFTIQVTSVGVTALDASPQCPGALLSFREEAATVDIPAGGTGTVPVIVRVDAGLPDACQGATWPLSFIGTAVSSAGGSPTSSPNADGSGSGTRGGGLALTGADLAGLAAVGAGLVAVGVTARRVSRRRRRGAALASERG